MKSKYILLFPILALLVAALACGRESPPTAPPDQNLPPADTPVTPVPAATFTPDYSGPCANVLFPFVTGRQWVYQKLLAAVDGGPTPTPDPLTSKFGITVADVRDSQATLNTLDLATGATTQTTATCQDGAITEFPMMTLGSLFGNYLAGDIQVTYVSGVIAPSRADLDAASWNMQWAGEYVAAGSVTLTAEGDQTTLTLDNSPLRMAWQNAGQETVSVPAGTFENAYKVTRTADLDASINVEGLLARGTLTVETVHWFAPYVGLIKTEVVSAHLTAMGISFPIEMAGSSLELFEYHP